MRCLTCETLSLSIICKQCQKTLLKPSLFKRELNEELIIYSFYPYEELEELLQSKYKFHGDPVLNILAQLSFAQFARAFYYSNEVLALPIDDHIRDDYSHSAILAKHLKSQSIKPIYNELHSQSRVKYAGKDLKYRQKHPRKFELRSLKDQNIILVDDIVTTGTTLLEAQKVCEKEGNTTLFALCLADAKIGTSNQK